MTDARSRSPWLLVLAVVVGLGVVIAGVWVTLVKPNAPLPPEFEEDWVTWITEKQRADGRAPNAEAWANLERAAEMWNRINDEFWRNGTPEGADPLTVVVLRDGWPSADPLDRFSVECLELRRELGVFEAAEAWFDAGAPMQPWDLRETPISPGSTARSMCRALMMMTRYDVAANDQPSLVRRFEIAFELADAAASERNLIGQLVAQAISLLITQELRFVAAGDSLSATSTTELIRQLSNDDTPPWEQVVEGSQRFIAHYESEKSAFANRSELRSYEHERRLYWREFVETAPDTLVELPFIEDVRTTNWKNLTAVQGMDQLRFILTASRQYELLRLLERRGTACLLAIELFRIKNDRLPTSLDEAADAAGLSAEMRIDTSVGQQFVYRVDPEAPRGYQLYALGADGIDNGGRFDPPKHPAAAFQRIGHGYDYNLLAPRPYSQKATSDDAE